MAAPRKKPTPKVKTVSDESYTELEMYCIWLNEYYTALKKAGFDHSMAAMLMMDKDSFPDWVSFKPVKDLLEEEDDD